MAMRSYTQSCPPIMSLLLCTAVICRTVYVQYSKRISSLIWFLSVRAVKVVSKVLFQYICRSSPRLFFMKVLLFWWPFFFLGFHSNLYFWLYIFVLEFYCYYPLWNMPDLFWKSLDHLYVSPSSYQMTTYVWLLRYFHILLSVSARSEIHISTRTEEAFRFSVVL